MKLNNKGLSIYEIEQINNAMDIIHNIMTDIEYSSRDHKIYRMLDKANGFLYNAVQNSYVEFLTER